MKVWVNSVMLPSWLMVRKVKGLSVEPEGSIVGNADYSVENLSTDLDMIRGNLYKRIQAIVGLSPFELMRKLKIARGRVLLEQQSGNISEIAWNVGLSPKQFSKYFKEEYGVLPSEFVKGLADTTC